MRIYLGFFFLVLLQLQGCYSESETEEAATPWIVTMVYRPKMLLYDEHTSYIVCNITVTNATRNGTVSFLVTDLQDFLLNLANRTYTITRDRIESKVSAASVDNFIVNYTSQVVPKNYTGIVGAILIQITGNRVGRSDISIVIQPNGVDSVNDTLVSQTEVTVVRQMREVDMIFRWVITAFLIFATFGMGCELDLKIIWTILKKPFAPLIGFCSQYILMPTIAIVIGQIFLKSEEMKLFGFGMLAVGCSPGGGGSNMWTILLGGDLNLSMTMTAISTTLALGMMPLWLFLTAPLYIDVEKVVIPYEMIVIQLALFVGPSLVGVALKSWKPKIAGYMKKPVRWGSLFFFIFMLTYGTWVNLYIYRTIGYFPYLLAIGGLLPWCGFGFGYLVAFILRQGHKRALTIAIETGIQNIGVPMIILRFAFPPPEGDIGAVMVMITALFTPLPLYLALITRGIYRCTCKSKKSSKSTWDDDDAGRVDPMAEKTEQQVTMFLNRNSTEVDDPEVSQPIMSLNGETGHAGGDGGSQNDQAYNGKK